MLRSVLGLVRRADLLGDEGDGERADEASSEAAGGSSSAEAAAAALDGLLHERGAHGELGWVHHQRVGLVEDLGATVVIGPVEVIDGVTSVVPLVWDIMMMHGTLMPGGSDRICTFVGVV